MKNNSIKRQITFIIVLFISSKSFTQDIMNPYRNSNQSISDLTVPLATGTTLSYSWVNIDQTRIIVGSFDGEYEIELPDSRNFWHSLRAVAPTLYISYEMEVKSFPFTPDCYLDPTGCGNNNTINRRLVLPSEPYNQQLDSWGLLNRIKPITSLEDGQSQTLVSIGYKDNLPLAPQIPGTGIRYYLPHSVIKFIINLHCEPFSIAAPTTPAFYSINWTFDNTRGRMRYYPFCSCNCASCQSPALYDITFSPQFIFNNNSHKYNQPNTNFFNTSTQKLEYEVTIPSGTINYYDFQELATISPCSNPKTSIPTANDYFYTGSNFDHIYLPQYSVISALPLQSIGISPAGYKYNGSTNLYEVIPSIRHDYEINYDFDIVQNEISQSDHIFYNPSDVTVTAPDLYFPSHYSFRTIRGVYPSPAEVAADDIAINGGPFNDPRDVPVRTDLRCEDATFPHSTSNPDDAKYASLYRLASGSKLTLEPCVSVFDAAFILNPGSTLELSNKTSIIGLHRVVIDRYGGRLIEKYELNSGTLYLQKKTETALAPNSYYVNSKIVAGENVDALSPVGPYIASTGTNLELVASDYIKLDHGFHAENGSEVKIQIDPFLQIPPCPPPPPASGGSGNRFANPSANSIVDVAAHIKLLPTLFSNSTGIYSENVKEDPIVSIEVLDASGKKIKQINEIYDYYVEVELSAVNEGMYFFIIQTKNNRKVLKGVKQN